MPVIANPDHQLRIVHTICSGLLTIEEIEHYQKTTWLVPEIYGYNELFDLSDADISNLRTEHFIQMAENVAKLHMLDTNSRLALLICNKNQLPLAEFYLAAKTLLPVPTREAKIFESKDAAMNWLQEDHR
ncbi:MAG: hypothetical protein KAU21_06845, partial [Gammaproteobacteria bacterium]|nr:hypothetical protein [Gammaproteobacteria bacterium]